MTNLPIEIAEKLLAIKPCKNDEDAWIKLNEIEEGFTKTDWYKLICSGKKRKNGREWNGDLSVVIATEYEAFRNRVLSLYQFRVNGVNLGKNDKDMR